MQYVYGPEIEGSSLLLLIHTAGHSYE